MSAEASTLTTTPPGRGSGMAMSSSRRVPPRRSSRHAFIERLYRRGNSCSLRRQRTCHLALDREMVWPERLRQEFTEGKLCARALRARDMNDGLRIGEFADALAATAARRA